MVGWGGAPQERVLRVHDCEKQAEGKGLCSGGWELAALHGMPATCELANALKLESPMKAPISNTALCSCAPWTQMVVVDLCPCFRVLHVDKVGNSMHMACIALALVAAVMLTMPV